MSADSNGIKRLRAQAARAQREKGTKMKTRITLLLLITAGALWAQGPAMDGGIQKRCKLASLPGETATGAGRFPPVPQIER